MATRVSKVPDIGPLATQHRGHTVCEREDAI